jgi:excinuclease ABC subunit C
MTSQLKKETPAQRKSKELPDQPGVYFFKDKSGKIIYVGKAKVLKNRVRSYFTGQPDRPKTAQLIERIWDLEIIITRTEVEALLTEANFIKEFTPKYNIDLRDDKTFPYIRITKESFPQVYVTRTVVKDGSVYYGPYTNVKYLRSALQVIKRIFTIRSCRYRLDAKTVESKKIDLCLDYHIKKCDGPCQALVDETNYDEMIKRVEDFLKGRTEKVEAHLENQMKKASSNLAFEDATRYRDRLLVVQNYVSNQRLKTSDFEDRDVIGLVRQDALATATMIRIRGGKLIGKEHFKFKNIDDDENGEIISRLIMSLYEQGMTIPGEIIVPVELADKEVIETWLSEIRGLKTKLKVPEIGEKKSLLELAERNAELSLKEWALQQTQKVDIVPKMIRMLQDDLQLPGPPRRIDGFDISHLGGTETVASMVCFIDGRAKPSEYRKFKVKTVEGIDDFASMREVVARRYKRVKEENLPTPDLILIDGGKGQLSAALTALHEVDMAHIPILGLAKRLEEVFIPGHSEALLIGKSSPSLILLRRLRDEAHRFAVTFQRKRRKTTTLTSVLDTIPGVGKNRVKSLMKAFGSVAKIKKAEIHQIADVGGISIKLAQNILDHLNGKNSEIKN